MPKPTSRDSFNHKSKGREAVAWNCTKCGKTGLANSRLSAGQQFDKHDCKEG